VSLETDLAAVFAEPTLTVPVSLVGTGAATRAVFDRRGELQTLSGFGVAVVAERDTLTLPTGALPGAAQEAQVVVGPIGSAVADETQGGTRYRIVRMNRTVYGLLTELALAGGKEG
jgi:hypothetical protein